MAPVGAVIKTLSDHIVAGVVKVVDIGAVTLPFAAQALMHVLDDVLRADIGTGVGETGGFGPLGIGGQRRQQITAVFFGAAFIGCAHYFKRGWHISSPMADEDIPAISADTGSHQAETAECGYSRLLVSLQKPQL